MKWQYKKLIHIKKNSREMIIRFMNMLSYKYDNAYWYYLGKLAC